MFPVINLRETGMNLHRIMDKRGITTKDIKEYLHYAEKGVGKYKCEMVRVFG